MLMSGGPPITTFPYTPGVANPFLNPYMQYMLPKEDTTLTKIFVGGLPYHTSSKVLREFFEQFGEIKEAVVIMDKATDKSKGYGFVTMAEPRGAEAALKEPNPVIDGRQANVNLAILGAKQKTLEHPYYAISFPMVKSQPAAAAAQPTIYQQFPSNAHYMSYPSASHITGMPLMAHPGPAHLAQPGVGAVAQTPPYVDPLTYMHMQNYTNAYQATFSDPYNPTAVSAGTPSPPSASGVYPTQAAAIPYAMALSPTSATVAPSAAAAAPPAPNIQMGSSYQAAVATQHQLQ